MLRITTKTRDQIATEFESVFKDIRAPEPVVRVTQAQRLAPYRKEIMKLRRRGLSWTQIAHGMSQPPIDEKVSTKLLSALFGPKEKPAKMVTKSTPLGQTNARI